MGYLPWEKSESPPFLRNFKNLNSPPPPLPPPPRIMKIQVLKLPWKFFMVGSKIEKEPKKRTLLYLTPVPNRESSTKVKTTTVLAGTCCTLVTEKKYITTYTYIKNLHQDIFVMNDLKYWYITGLKVIVNLK